MATWHSYTASKAEDQHTVVGELNILPKVWSPQLNNERDILVYLPASYAEGERRYPVLYMHDGQNLFDQGTCFGQEWGVDETKQALAEHGIEAIVVGIPNSCADRCAEYSPFADSEHGGGQGDQYLTFIIETVKPLIDADFRTLPSREHTGILGSSMGGLISLYAFFHYGHVFGLAGAMSPALWYGDRSIYSFVEQAPAHPGRLYLDVGTDEGDEELTDVRRMGELLLQKGYALDDTLLYVEDDGAGHHEGAWARRLFAPFCFLLHEACRDYDTLMADHQGASAN